MEDEPGTGPTPAVGTHGSFRIISGGRELPFPMFRIVGLVAVGILIGILVAS